MSVTNRNSMLGGAETGFTCRSQKSQVIRCPHKYCSVAALAQASKRHASSLWAYLDPGVVVSFIVDASPWGLGAVLLYDGKPAEFFANAVSDVDCRILGFKRGSSAGQQSCEALAVLVALRHWAQQWSGRRCTVAVQSDSVSALTLMVHCQARGKGPAVIARELALDLAEEVYRPHVGSHVAGVSNTIADALSRQFAPGGGPEVPEALRKARSVLVAQRDRGWWRTLSAPPRGTSPHAWRKRGVERAFS